MVFFAAQTTRISNGVGTYAAALSDALAKAGHAVTLVTPDMGDGHAAGVTHRRVGVSPIDPSPGQWWSLARAFARDVATLERELRPDLFHFADAREALFVRRGAIPIVGSVHDDYAACAPRSPFALRRVHPDAWKRAGWYAVQRVLERRAYRRLDRIIANSEAVARSIAGRYGIARQSIAIVHPSIPNDRALASGEKLPGDPAILFVGANFFRKGLATLIEAAARLRTRLPRITVSVIGDDPRRSAAESIAERLGVAGSVRFLGHRSRREVLETYGRCDLVAVPSHTEGFGLVLLEAMRAGVPVIGGAVSGTRELVRDGIDGILVPPGDVDALVRAIDRIRDDAAFREDLVDGGRRRARSFTIDACLERTLAVYRSVLERRR
ncbi:MAG: glycosyltransferase family 4 protein [Planctomycetes bacterium]|nr:glycosyltransferase family 4 protein [Planctomycetota bacterium]MBI3846252.1 glycosyltransferase family 4 protein [Planctomycetota bacterium]